MSGPSATSGNRVLVLGRLQTVLDPILHELRRRGIAAQGTVAAEQAPERFDARDFDLISIGGGLFGAAADRLKAAFGRQNPDVRFLDAFGPVAVRQIVAALGNHRPADPHLGDLRVVADGPDQVVYATVRKPATVTVEVYRTIEAPPPPVDPIIRQTVQPGPFTARIAARYLPHALMLLVTVAEDADEFFPHRMSQGAT